MKGITIACLALVTLASCAKEPTACIDAPTEALVHEKVSLKNCSEDAESYEWSIKYEDVFGYLETESYSDENISHSWERGGEFQISLTAFSKKEKKENEVMTTIKIIDQCQSCYKEAFDHTTIHCLSDYDSTEQYEAAIESLESDSYECSRINP